MSSQRMSVRPPRLAAWLVTLFTPAGRAESIVGDLLEEFSQLVSKSGSVFARRWYWQQAWKTIVYLMWVGFRSAPWTIIGIAVGGFLLRWFVSRWSHPAFEGAIETVLERYQVYERSPDAYIFWLTHIFLVERLVVHTLTGVIVAIVAKGREMTATIALGLLGDILAVQATWMTVARTGDHGVLATLPWSLAFSIAVVVGGAIVRMLRLSTTNPASAT